MCGIGGILRTDGQPIPEEWLDAIDARIAYRGPDGHGRFRDRVETDDPSAPNGKRIVEVAFVHRRLSIIDQKDGAQPMVSERGRNHKEGLVAVVFNGCIYNHRELRKELENKGHRFVTDHSDTEVLIHGWREWGTDLIERIDGMYSFAVWDRTQFTLALGRDTFGEKPLYVTDNNGNEPHSHVVAFGSETLSVGGLFPDVRSGNQNEWLDNWCLQGYAAPTWTKPSALNSGPDELEPNDLVLYDYRGYAGSCIDTRLSMDRASHTADDFAPLLERAVARRLEADVPLGCFLSGGVDSSLVAHFAKLHKHDLKTFSVRMPDARYDESSFAESVARHIGTQHMTLEIAFDPSSDLLHLIHILGQPFGDSSILPAYWVSKGARQHVTVALSGDGGDELFIGYERYMAARKLANHWFWLRALPLSFLRRAHPKSRWNKLGRIVDMARDYSSLGLAAMESLFTVREIEELTERRFAQPIRCDAGADALAALRQFDIDNYLPGDLLRKVDTASMACGLEVRCPFLDRDLARAAISMPIEQLMPGGQRKGLLRNIARKYLPKEIVDRPKMGFAIPIGEWFRDDDLPHKGGGMKTLLLDHLNSTEPFGPIQLNRKAVQRFIDEHMSCKRDHGQKLFTLLTLSIWAKMFAKSA